MNTPSTCPRHTHNDVKECMLSLPQDTTARVTVPAVLIEPMRAVLAADPCDLRQERVQLIGTQLPRPPRSVTVEGNAETLSSVAFEVVYTATDLLFCTLNDHWFMTVDPTELQMTLRPLQAAVTLLANVQKLAKAGPAVSL